MFISVVLLIVSLVVLISSTHDHKSSNQENDNPIVGYEDSFDVNKASKDLPKNALEKYNKLYNINSDTVGWLKLPGTPIDLPVVQYKDNEYYKTTDFNGENLVGFSAYADCNIELSNLPRQTILYVASGEQQGLINGIKDYKLFGSEQSSSDIEISEGLPMIMFGNLYEDYEWKVFACLLSDDDSDTISKLGAQELDELKAYLTSETLYDPSYIENIKSGDKLLIISLPYEDFESENFTENKRLILVATLLDQQINDQ